MSSRTSDNLLDIMKQNLREAKLPLPVAKAIGHFCCISTAAAGAAAVGAAAYTTFGEVAVVAVRATSKLVLLMRPLEAGIIDH
ncbi:hypothetical protein PI124_g5916 [Phytophthora idaei]|nr:hypothetical protein PI124_g5916 [Phytophthora idaei]